MTSTPIIAESAAERTLLLRRGVRLTHILPRQDDSFQERAAAWLEAHPEVSATIPGWAEEVEFESIEDPMGETVAVYTRDVGPIRLQGSVTRHNDGTVVNDGAVTLLLPVPGEVTGTAWQAAQVAGGLALYLKEVARLLNDEDLA